MKSLMKFLAAVAMVAAPALTGMVSAQDDAPSLEAPQGDTVVFVKIEQAPDLEGVLLDLATVELTTSFGAVPVPVEKIDGIKMNADGGGTAVIAFKNGDLLTGTSSMSTLKLKTGWGTAHIDASAIESVTMTKDGRFFQDNAGGVQSWRFSKVTAEAAPARRPATRPVGQPMQNPQPVRQFGG